MTAIPINLPLRGFTEQTPYSVTPDGMTQSCLNVMPIDPWNGRTRIGTRNGTVRYNTGGGVQFMGTYRVYSGGLLVENLIYVRNGLVYYSNPHGTAPVAGTLFGGQGGAPLLVTSGTVEGVQFNEHFYLVDGTNYVVVNITDPTNASAVALWGAPSGGGGGGSATGPYHTDSTVGTTAGNRARLICRWGARLVLAGYRPFPNIWFACSPDNPYPNTGTDGWDASVSIGALAAGTNEEFGTLGDPIVAIFPFAETGLMFGCSNSFAFLTSDPAFDDNARIVNLTKSIGIAGQRAFCQAQEKGAYILGNDGLYFLTANNFNFNRASRISAGRLDSFFLRIDFGTPAIGGSSALAGGTLSSLMSEYGSGTGASAQVIESGTLVDEVDALETTVPSNVAAFTGDLANGDVFPCLCYDPDREGVWMFLSVNGQESSSLHLYYDVKTDSFWPIRFYDPINYAPLAACYSGPSRTKSGKLFMGTFEGISTMNRSITVGIDGFDAEGMTEALQNQRFIRNSLTIGPIIPQLPYRAMLTEVRIDMNEEKYELPSTYTTDYSRGPNLSISTGETAQSAIGLSNDTLFITQINPLTADCGTSTTSGSPLYDGGDSDDVSVNTLDGRYAARPFGQYATVGTFDGETSRIYIGPAYWVFRYDSSASKWKVQYDSGPAASPRYTDEYEQVVPSASQPNSTLVTTVQIPISPHVKDNAVVSGASFDTVNVTEIGNLVRGRNEAQRCRIRAEAMYMTIASDGKPWAVERMSAFVTQVGKSRGGAPATLGGS